MAKVDFIRKDIVKSVGSQEGSSVYVEIEIRTGESELVISKTITERYPVQEYDKVIDLHDRLTCGGGRQVFSLEDLAHKFNPNN